MSFDNKTGVYMHTKFRFPLIAVMTLLTASIACALGAQPGLFVTQPPAAVTQVVLAPTQAALAPTVAAPPTQNATAPTAPSLTVNSSEEDALVALYQRVNPAVVSITVLEDVSGPGVPANHPQAVAQGSGFLYDTEGHIVTNQHVVDGAQSIEVDFASGLKTRAQVVGVDPDSDLAVIKVDEMPPGVAPLSLGDSDAVKVGQRAIAIGNPFGEAGTMTVGIVSGLGRTLEGNRAAPGSQTAFTAPDIIQTDAPINPGNSGGPLLDLSGDVIGLNRAIAVDNSSGSGNAAGTGVGYAIASNTIKQIAPFLIKDGKFVYPYLGITSTSEISLDMKEQLGLPQTNGTYVTSVVAGGPADKAGLLADSASVNATQFNGNGDLIIAVDNREVHVFADLMSYLVNHTRPGQEITLTVLRKGEQLNVKVVLAERP